MARTYRLEQGPGYFVKQTPETDLQRLSAEADGLMALDATGEIRVPEVALCEVVGGQAWLVMEWLDIEPRGREADQALGRALARLHRHTGAFFGWERDNFIGRSPQINTPGEDWSAFFIRCRLAPQLEGLGGAWPDWLEAASSAFKRLVAGHEPVPSLVHGDLWSGNAAALASGQPVLYDPAVHYADRECDLAMTRLFGGFGPGFYQAYEAEWPLPPGGSHRQAWYRLYHLLNHARLFGGHYLAESRRLLAELTGS